MKNKQTQYSEEQVKTIQRIANKLAPKYAFGSYDRDDMIQEAVIMGLEALDRYDPNQPLENFMYIHISNRLKNFVRDNYQRSNYICPYCQNKAEYCDYCEQRQILHSAKKSLAEPAILENSPLVEEDTESWAELKEMKEIIDHELPVEMRADYLRMQQGVYVQKSRREDIKNKIREIISEKEKLQKR